MAQLDICQCSDAAILTDFHCGVVAMDHFIHCDLQQFLSRHECQMYVVFDDRDAVVPVAMFVVSDGLLELDESLKANVRQLEPELYASLTDNEWWQNGKFPVLELDYLAVREDCRKKHIGLALMNAIFSLAKRRLGETCRFIGVDAYCSNGYSSVPFYRKCDFFVAGSLMPGEDTIRMYHVLS